MPCSFHGFLIDSFLPLCRLYQDQTLVYLSFTRNSLPKYVDNILLNIVTCAVNSSCSFYVTCFSNLFSTMLCSTSKWAISLQSLQLLTCFLKSFKSKLLDCIISSTDVIVESLTTYATDESIYAVSGTKGTSSLPAKPKSLSFILFRKHYSLIITPCR